MMSNASNASSLVCPTIAWTPTPRSRMELSTPMGFRPNVMNSSQSTAPAYCVTSNAHQPQSSPLSPQSLQHSPHQPQTRVSPTTAPAPMPSRVSWMSPHMNRGATMTSETPSATAGANLLIPSSNQSLQRNQMPLVMLPISVGATQPVYDNRSPAIQPLSHRPNPVQSGPCYYQSLSPPGHHPYTHPMMLSHEPPVSQRERTKPLRDWILKHRSHPYPSKEDKLALAMMTRMRLDQVSMWFANTRRQIRKVGMKAWSGGMFSAPLPHRVGNGAIIPVPDEEREDEMEEESSLTCSSDDSSSGRIPTDSSCSLE